jgi:hypothetical protein
MTARSITLAEMVAVGQWIFHHSVPESDVLLSIGFSILKLQLWYRIAVKIACVRACDEGCTAHPLRRTIVFMAINRQRSRPRHNIKLHRQPLQRILTIGALGAFPDGLSC